MLFSCLFCFTSGGSAYIVLNFDYMYTFIMRYPSINAHTHMRNVSKIQLHMHTMKVEAPVWLENSSCACGQFLSEDEYAQNEVYVLLFCQDHPVCELWKYLSFLFTPIFEDLSAAQPCMLQQVNNQLQVQLFILSLFLC